VVEGQMLWEAGEPVKHAYLVSEGSLVFEEMRDDLDTPFDSGAFVCDIASMMSRRAVECGQEAEGPTTSKVSLVASSRSIVYAVDADDIMEYLDHNPGILINLIDSLVME
jgi:CRP-like cAMP-binding protein